MDASLKARLGPRVRVKAVDLFSGSPGAFVLSARSGKVRETVSVVMLLMRCGVTASRGKAAIERLLKFGSTALEIPIAPKDLPNRLAAFGIVAVQRDVGSVDVAAIRNRLGITQEEFAARFGLTAATIKNWEQHRSEPDAAARAYLKVIDRHPEIADEVVSA